jgi:predicted DNA binding protein
MSVIAELRVGATEFELGRILQSADPLDIELETMVPLRERPVPFFLVHDDVSEAFEARVARHPSVVEVREIERRDDEVLFALTWEVSQDDFFEAIDEVGAQLIAARSAESTWAFELRFPSHDALSEFRELCDDARISLAVDRIYNPTRPEDGPWFGLTEPQRETLVRAVEGGYYAIPRRMSTKDLAEEFGVSDQAITERLRRAIVSLAEHTVVVRDIREAQ